MRTAGKSVSYTAVPGVPLIEPGDDLGAILIERVRQAGIVPRDHDIFAVTQKVVSKAEGGYVDLTEVVRHGPGVLVAAHRLGFVMANAGIDQSNIRHADGERVLLLPEKPDATCASLKARIDECFGVDLAVVINDSFGRPWRNGVVGVALGAAGLPALLDLVGAPDLFGRPMRVTEVALADEVAAAASLLMGEADAALPLVHVRGLAWDAPPRNAAA